jgi:hypothetical protein
MMRSSRHADTSGVRRVAADVLWLVHIGVMVFLAIGWALPWSSAWWIYCLGAPCVIGGWKVFSETCWLSILEAKLRGEPMSIRALDAEVEESRSFVAETLSRALGRPVSRRFAKTLSYGVVIGGFILSGIRLAL